MNYLQKLDKEYNQRPIRQILKLPCGCTSIEITRPQDQYVTCPECYKKFLLIWQSKPKIQYYTEREL